jgi:hypothetical protein
MDRAADHVAYQRRRDRIPKHRIQRRRQAMADRRAKRRPEPLAVAMVHVQGSGRRRAGSGRNRLLHKRMLWFVEELPFTVEPGWTYRITDNSLKQNYVTGGVYWKKDDESSRSRSAPTRAPIRPGVHATRSTSPTMSASSTRLSDPLPEDDHRRLLRRMA